MSVNRFHALLPYQASNEFEKLSEEFTEYQLLQDSEVPTEVWEEATMVEGHQRMDVL